MNNTAMPTKLSRYEIESELGRGGMGTVYKAKDPVLDRTVALKVSRLDPSGEAGERQKRMLGEARLAARFIHPNIAITYDAGFENELFYMAIEFVDGSGLEASSRKPNLLPVSTVLETAYNVCFALDYIHDKGYLHMDVKPANIMLTRRGEVKLMDFGIARMLKSPEGGNQEISGSFHYMSPEQATPGETLDARTDLYSLGVVLYELLSGKRPFSADQPMQILYQVTRGTPEPIEELAPDLHPDLAALVRKAMHRDREERFESAREMAERLLPFIKGSDSSAVDYKDKKKIAYLRSIPFFRHFQFAELSAVLALTSWSHHKAGTWIVEESSQDNRIYFLVMGSAEVHLRDEARPLARGEWFGDSAILYSMPRFARVLAKTDCVVMALNASLLNQADPAILVKFMKEFYRNKMLQLVDLNLKLIQQSVQ